MGKSKSRFALWRRCNECGLEAYRRDNQCKRWDKALKKTVFCGTMRVIRPQPEPPNDTEGETHTG